MSHFIDKEVIDEWVEHSRVGKDSQFRVQFVNDSVEIQLFADPNWIVYRTDDTIKQLITRLYEENRQLQDEAEYSHHDAESI